jgi:hypothetical protein
MPYEITEDMIIENIKTVAARIGAKRLSWRQYNQHGSFAWRHLIRRRFQWRVLVEKAGLLEGRKGRPKAVRVPCRYGCGRMSREHRTVCKTCRNRLIRQSRGMVTQ